MHVMCTGRGDSGKEFATAHIIHGEGFKCSYDYKHTQKNYMLHGRIKQT